MSLMYRFPKFYNFLIMAIHKEHLDKRFKYISMVIGKNKSVLELGCGTALLESYLLDGCSYEGWDLNKNFLNYCTSRGKNVKYMDVFRLPEEKTIFDVMVISDLLHHVIPNHQILLEMATSRAKMVVVSEPAKSYKPSKLCRPIRYAIYYLFGDYDGINPISNLFRWNFNEVTLQELYKKNEFVNSRLIGRNLVAVYQKSVD